MLGQAQYFRARFHSAAEAVLHLQFDIAQNGAKLMQHQRHRFR